jgi:4-hydroxythreonine-4-phosphate dehydrogenase
MSDGPIKAGISIGDPNGIGPEIIMKTFMDNRVLDTVTPIIYGSSRIFNNWKKLLDFEEFGFHGINDASEALPKKINMVRMWKDDFEIRPGEASTEAGKVAFASLKNAVADLASGKCDVLVTAPIDKKVIQSQEFDFPGHTEYLAKMSEVDDALMFLVSENLRVGVVTGHIPLQQVSESLKKDKIVKKIEQMIHSLERDFMIRKPRIAVLGLNPHAGEKGMLGTEEQEIINPAINAAKEKGHWVFGPFAADGFFGSGAYKQFDAVLAMYHDQGLAPFKSLSFGTGVNFTAGLPIVRTSPDHGTAFEIAGKDEASEASFRTALYLAADIYNSRKLYREMTANPLKPQKVAGEYGE